MIPPRTPQKEVLTKAKREMIRTGGGEVRTIRSSAENK